MSEIDRLYSVKEAKPLLGMSTATLYVALKDGRVRAIKQGHRTFISAKEIARFQASLAEWKPRSLRKDEAA